MQKIQTKDLDSLRSHTGLLYTDHSVRHDPKHLVDINIKAVSEMYIQSKSIIF